MNEYMTPLKKWTCNVVTMTKGFDAAAVRTRFKAAVAARKSTDQARVAGKGADVLKLIKTHAKADLETVEALFLQSYDAVPLIERIEHVGAVHEETDESE